ncbi:MAG TPA: cytochrome c [Pseudolabrys sp.]|nr:cytochrome c [Pseudolabrys sp.]
MHMRNIAAAACGLALCAAPVLAQKTPGTASANKSSELGPYGLGMVPTQQQIAGWNIDASRPDGSGLPPGSGSVSQGKQVYDQTCVACHGADGTGPMDRLVGGKGTLDSNKPVRTVGSYWPYATTLWDYIHRAMPFNSPQSLSPDQVYAVTAYVLYLNHIVPQDATMSRDTLPKVKMPNQGDFIRPDPRPDVHNIACMSNCPPLAAKPVKTEKPNPSQVQ